MKLLLELCYSTKSAFSKIISFKIKKKKNFDRVHSTQNSDLTGLLRNKRRSVERREMGGGGSR